MSRLTLLVAVAAVLVAPPVDAGPCAVPTIGAVSATKPNAVVQDGGGVIVTLGRVDGPSDEVVRAPVSDVSRDDWRFVDGGKLVKPTIDKIAPGLAVYRLPDSKSTSYVLETAKHTKIVSVKRALDRGTTVLPAPVVVGGGQVDFPPMQRGGGGSVVTVHLVAPAPKGAFVLIAYGPDGVARSSGTPEPGSKDVSIWHTRDRCETEAPGTLPSSIGEKITVAWLDESGRLSAKSAPIEIKPEKQK